MMAAYSLPYTLSMVVIREDIPKKAAVFWTLSKSSPLPLKFGQQVQLFLNAKTIDLSVIQNDSLSKILLEQRQNTCFVGTVYNLKNSFKFKLLAFWMK